MEENMKKKVCTKGIVITAVITAVVIIAACAVSVYVLFGDAIKFKHDYPKLVEIAGVIDAQYIGDYSTSDIAESAAYDMVTATGDKWSYYLSADELTSYTLSVNNSYVGIGVTISKAEGEYIKIEQVEADSGAYDAGIQIGDYLTAIDGQDISAMSTSDIKGLITGEEGSTTELTIMREGSEMQVLVERKKLQVKSVDYELIGNTGYVKILNFFNNTAESFIAAVDDLIDQGAESLVFDVRFNGGGYLHELLDMLDYLLPEGVIFRSEDINGNTSTNESDASCIELPMAVLVNDKTYSAAEYFAEAIREFQWGTVVGTQTSGKGYSQQLIMLSDGSAINLSTMKYYTPSGECLAGIGITPDIVIETEEEEYYSVYYRVLDTNDDSQLQAALEEVSK